MKVRVKNSCWLYDERMLPTPLRALVTFFRQPPAAEPLQDPAQVSSTYRLWRSRMLVSSLIGYGLFYFCRKNISVALPLLAEELGYSNIQLGVLGSLLYVSYAVAKGSFGLVCDRVDPRRFMAVGLGVSALLNLAFGSVTALWAFGLIWFLNGVVQAMGAPPCAKICARWFSVGERGTMWSIWNISHQAGGGIILVLAAWLAQVYGWRAAFWGPAAICLVGVGFIVWRLRDRPEQFGLPPIEVYRDDPEHDEGSEEEQQLTFFQLVLRRVLTNRYLLLLALSSTCVYVVRYGTLDWATKYLVETKGMGVAAAGGLTSLIEFFGIPGMLLAGFVSDRLFDARRGPVCVISMAALAGSIVLLYLVPPGHPVLDGAALAAIGFFTYGPQCLLAGVAAADTCGAQVAAAAVGITGTFSYAGAIISSAGTGALVDRYGWAGGFSLWVGCALLCVLLLLPLWGSRGRRR